MPTTRPLSGAEFAQSWLGKFFLGGLPILAGTLTILLSVNVLTYVDLHPNRIAIFNDPHTWQVFAVGMSMLCFGVANILPPRMQLIGRLNLLLLLTSVLAVVVGIVLKKLA